MAKHYTEEFKRTAMQRYEHGENLKALSLELNVAESTLYRWRTEYCSVATDQHTYTLHEIKVLVSKLDKAEHKLEIIKLSGFLQAVPLQDRLTVLEKQYNAKANEYSVHELCDALEVARGTFYNHILRRADPSSRQEEEKYLEEQVRQVFEDSSQRFGAEKIRAILKEKGIHMSKKRISRLMQKMNLKSVRPDAKKEYVKREKENKKNYLQRQFTAEKPNLIWVSDITQFKVKDYWVYLCVILDIYSRKVVGYKTAPSASVNLVTSTFRSAYEKRGRPENLTFHSDRGTPYVSNAFAKLAKKCGVRQSFSKTGSPHDNAVAESFFASFKKEEAYRHDYTSERDFMKSVEKYMAFYNTERPHCTIGYKTPDSFESCYYESCKSTEK